VSLLAIGCAAVVKLKAAVLSDTPHHSECCPFAPDREQAHSYK
jgi:hypothetical protein